MITTQLLIGIGATASNAERFAEPLKAACSLFDISTPKAVAGLIGQCAVESAMFSQFVESLYHRDAVRLASIYKRIRQLPVNKRDQYLKNSEKLANFVYSGLYGNGDEASGDGYRYRGRGAIQTTFKANYDAAAKLTGRPYVEQPELLEEPEDAALSAAAYFRSRGAVELANNSQWDAVTKVVNPAMLEARKRALLSTKALSLLS